MCTLAAPWPKKPLLGIFHAYQAAALLELGVEMKLFSPSPVVPRWAGMASPRARGHIERPRRYEMYGADVLAPRVPFAFPSRVRFGLAKAAPGLVDSWARAGIGRYLRATLDELQPDALVMHGAMPWGRLVAGEAKARGLPCALIEHSADDVMRLRADTKLSDYYAEVAGRVDAVFAVGPQMVTHLHSVAGVAAPRLLSNGTTKTSAAQLRAPRPKSLHGKFVVLAAANYYRRKGLEELVAAFSVACRDVPDAELHLVVAAPNSLREQIAVSGVAERIVVHDPMAPDELRQWMVWADVFALPAWSEAYGLVYAEALSAGTPTILTDDCGFADVVRRLEVTGDCAAWVIPPRDHGALSAVLAEAANAPQRCAEMGLAGRRFADRELGWNRNARALAESLSLCSA
jgi:teichuronic acid biosynthesis glycosyltransferase TuaC